MKTQAVYATNRGQSLSNNKNNACSGAALSAFATGGAFKNLARPIASDANKLPQCKGCPNGEDQALSLIQTLKFYNDGAEVYGLDGGIDKCADIIHAAYKAALAEVQRLKDQLAGATGPVAVSLSKQLEAAIALAGEKKVAMETIKLELASAQGRKEATATAQKEVEAALEGVTPATAASKVNDLAGGAAAAVSDAQKDQNKAAGFLLAAEVDEAEKLAKADAAAAAAKVAADLAAKIASAKSLEEVAAAAITAAADAKTLAEAAQKKSSDATIAANSAKDVAKELIQPIIKNDAELYMKSSPAVDGIDVTKITTSSARSIKALFTDAQLTANNGALQKFITQWDIYTVKEMEKFAAASEYQTKNEAYNAVDSLKTTLINSSFANLLSAKEATNATLVGLQNAAQSAADNAAIAANTALEQKMAEAKAQAVIDVALSTKKTLDDLYTRITASGADITALLTDLTNKLSTAASNASNLELLEKAADAAAKAVEAAETAAEAIADKVPVAEGGSRPSYATDVGTDL